MARLSLRARAQWRLTMDALPNALNFLAAAPSWWQTFTLHVQVAIAGLVATSWGSVIWQTPTRTTIASQRRSTNQCRWENEFFVLEFTILSLDLVAARVELECLKQHGQLPSVCIAANAAVASRCTGCK